MNWTGPYKNWIIYEYIHRSFMMRAQFKNMLTLVCFCETFANKTKKSLEIGGQNARPTDLSDLQWGSSIIWCTYIGVNGWCWWWEGGSVDLEKRKGRAVDDCTRQALLILQHKARMSSSKRFRRSFSITQKMAPCARFFSLF